VYTDGSKIGDNVGAAGIVFVNGKVVHQLKFNLMNAELSPICIFLALLRVRPIFHFIRIMLKLHGHFSNNQAKQIAILKLLVKLEVLQDGQDNDKRDAVYTDSKITLVLPQKIFKWNRLIESTSIRDKIIVLMNLKWIMHFIWVKLHAGTKG
jgi:hypothetical protein